MAIENYYLIQVEKSTFPIRSCIGEFGAVYTESCFILLETHVDLKSAKEVQKEYDNKTIILLGF